jgi:serine/threonine protein kinase
VVWVASAVRFRTPTLTCSTKECLIVSETAGFAVIGKHINNYEVVSLLGEGGMGTVYLALHPIMGRKAAIKVLKPELARDESLVMRFFNEARAANAIRHPNIIDIIDVGLLPEENVPYMLMEFLEGESLATRLDRTRPLDVNTAVEIAFQTASALAAAHSKGIVHRDLKPDNLFLVPDEMVGGGERVKVLDFGIAKLRDDMRGSSMKTRTGAIMGTAAYMSPEQCQGLIEKLDHRTDVYALGIILYEMLCGAPPFLSEGFGDIIIMHVMKEPENPQHKNPTVPNEVSAAILRALAKSPDDRFQSMLEFQAALRGHTATHSTPMHGLPSVGTTAILDEQPSAPARRSGVAFDETMATPAPVLLRPGSVPPSRIPTRPGSVPPSHISTVVEPVASPRQSTTFRNATGEISHTDLTSPGKTRTVIAVASIVGLAAVGLAITLFVTRSSGHPTAPAQPAAIAPERTAIPAVPAAQPERLPAFEPPPPPTAAAAPTVQPEPPPAEESRHHKKGSPGRPRRPVEKAVERRPAEPLPPSSAEEKKNTERW